MWPALVLLAIPIGHQLVGHRLLLRLRSMWTGELVPLTSHEQKHAAHSAATRWAINTAWLAFMGFVLFLAVV